MQGAAAHLLRHPQYLDASEQLTASSLALAASRRSRIAEWKMDSTSVSYGSVGEQLKEAQQDSSTCVEFLAQTVKILASTSEIYEVEPELMGLWAKDVQLNGKMPAEKRLKWLRIDRTVLIWASAIKRN